MNDAYSEEMAPPKELFSRTWYDSISCGIMIRDDLYSRINETKKKLEYLEVKLRTKIQNRGGGYHQVDLLENTITFLNHYIGVWWARKLYTSPYNVWGPVTTSHITMEYPHDKQVMSKWEEVVLGGVQREGFCLVMLSSECVEWLNMVFDYIGE